MLEKKNILVLTGSPRRNGNSDSMADAFIKGAQSAGHEVNIFETSSKDIGGCRACNTCWSKGKPNAREYITLNMQHLGTGKAAEEILFKHILFIREGGFECKQRTK